MGGGGLFLGYSLIIIKKTWGFISQTLKFDSPPLPVIRHRRVSADVGSVLDTTNSPICSSIFDMTSLLLRITKPVPLPFQGSLSPLFKSEIASYFKIYVVSKTLLIFCHNNSAFSICSIKDILKG